jgi:hypothetical protein
MINRISVILILYMLNYFTQAKHLNSVMMSSKPIGSNATYEIVEVTIYASIKRDYKTNQICDDAYIASSNPIGNTIDIVCDVGCGNYNVTVASTIVECTSYSIVNNWAMGIVY